VEDVPGTEDARRPLTAPRPGHADLAGAMKFNFHDARYILERASARETAARVAAGAIAKLLLRQFDCTVLSHVIAVGKARLGRAAAWNEIQAVCANLDSPLRCVDPATEAQMKGEVDLVHRSGNTVGGIFEVVAHNVITGLGSHAQWDEKLDGRLAQAVMSIQAVKGVEIGAGITAAASYGSEVMDEIGYDASSKRFTRATNRAGGLEGGITNGEDVVVRGYLKPISTLRSPLQTADMVTKQPITAAYERSDVCVVPAGGVAGEAMVSFVLAQALLEKFGGDSLTETRRNFEGYRQQLKEF
jgi:chorismate synthase